MIIVDFSQIFMAAMFTQNPTAFSSGKVDGVMRHIVLNSIRLSRKKFGRNLGVVIACEGSNSWRRQFFPHYKANRKTARTESPYESDKIFSLMKEIQDEIRENFPYRVLSVYEAEADDIIGVLTMRFHKEEPIVIVSKDKDFAQLDRYPSVKRYDPSKKVILHEADPESFLTHHIIIGDVSDGIPNILSKEDCFVTKTRQKPITKKFLRETELTMMCELQRFLQNRTLIDLREIPLYIQENIMQEYESAVVVEGRSKVLNYMISKELFVLIDDIQDF